MRVSFDSVQRGPRITEGSGGWAGSGSITAYFRIGVTIAERKRGSSRNVTA